jgi:transcriptional regulator with XRE-family HTH domain
MDENLSNSIGGRIRKVRQDAGLTQKVFGKEVGGVSLPTINRVENDQRSPSAELLAQISLKFGTDLNWLVTGKQQLPSETLLGKYVPLFKKLSRTLIDSPKKDIESMLNLPHVPPNAVACKCADDACAPQVGAGDIVIFVPGDCSVSDLTVVCDEWGNGLVRRKQKQDDIVVYIAEHKGYDRLNDDDVFCLGKVWGFFRRLSKS